MDMSTIGALVTIGVMLLILLLVNIDLMRIDRARRKELHVEERNTARSIGTLRAEFDE